ncbi:5-formyltetrahydrofolate cyclo-ligase [Parazoarcus communis]|uniref:5-formyltetrahydrofolate cyclo-ligase n=1 Tax=Parazoarcus communis SWub3 = DSM 12120 TaxID=1121029 RepID=A0A323V002_9RHOO|nr:5-formyltetrahydrofolate cyclo-ligase [Parazoarcus communis]NMG71933.1 5-formyltetrahydrofolate cyclo-ligase [Parazoarcus communis SWub3 = DSM 12120]PZA18179.1 5-formyltetrahydrofolate cyclo-ligase [Azoarcus communis] [Parazoarcus communis SWub3 = DSM 12120]
MTEPSQALSSSEHAARSKLRAAALAAREALPDTVRAERTRAMEAHLTALMAELCPKVLALCWPYRSEPDLRAWAVRWQASVPGRCLALPVVTARDQPLIFRAWSADAEMALDRHGIPHPAQGDAILPDVVLIPLNAFDGAGFRLGYGGGYFDRTLAVLQTISVGVGFEAGRVDSVMPQSHDRPMDWLVTEAGLWSCSDGFRA